MKIIARNLRKEINNSFSSLCVNYSLTEREIKLG